MVIKEDHGYDMDVNVRWVSNLSKNKSQSPALLGAHDILLSDIEIKLEPKEGKKDAKVDQMAGVVLKVTSGTKNF